MQMSTQQDEFLCYDLMNHIALNFFQSREMKNFCLTKKGNYKKCNP